VLSLLKRRKRRTLSTSEPEMESQLQSEVATSLSLLPEAEEVLVPQASSSMISASELPSAAAQLAELFEEEEPLAPIFASELPSAAAQLAELFPEDEPVAALPIPDFSDTDFFELLPIAPISAIAEVPAIAEPEIPSQQPTPGPETVSNASAQPAEETAKLPFLSEPPAAPLPPEPPAEPISGTADWAFEEQLANHVEWLESHGAAGRRADLTSADLEAAELISINLRLANLRDANLKAADLLLADLRDASLVRANLQDSCLVGANLEGANLEGASLESAMGLVPHQLAGTNLHDAQLPKAILKFEALPEFERGAQMAARFCAVTTIASFLSWLIIWRTKDHQLLANSSVIGFLHSSAAASALPADQFYLIAPVALFVIYVVFHFHLQRLWDATLQLPAVFPDGHALSDHAPRNVMGLLRAHFRWMMNQDAASTRLIEKAIAMIVAYWLVPLTLFFYWARYLTLQDVHGSLLQDLLVTLSGGIAFYSTFMVGRPAETWTLQKNRLQGAINALRKANPIGVTAGIGILLTFLCIGSFAGIPHEKLRAPQYMAGSIRRWASGALWSVGFEPYADLTESSFSTAPATWNGSDETLGAVRGPNLTNTNFRYAQAYGVFFANAHLFRANFQGALLSSSDLRGADLGRANLRFAILDEARLSHANLDRAILDSANLGRTDFRGANLSYASLDSAFLKDARLDSATLYGANLASATMVRTNFEHADLREAVLANANLDHADLQQAYLWSAKMDNAHLDNARLDGAIFIGANLHNADLRGAQLSGTALNEANLSGANLDGLDLRNTNGLTSNQICSAKSRRWLLLSDSLQTQVTAQCGAAR
jgi:uncharacterized protein YjbI with pentapeptide repeats